MTTINEIIDLQVLLGAGSTPFTNLSIPLILTSEVPLNTFTTKTRLYNQEDIVNDYPESTDTYKAISKMFSQTYKPKKVYIALRDTAVVSVKKIVFSTALITGNIVNGVVNGQVLTPTTFITDHATTMSAVATKIALAYGVDTATSALNEITVTGELEYSLDLSFTVNGGLSVPTVTYTTVTAGSTAGSDIAEAIDDIGDAFYPVCLVGRNEGSVFSVASKVQTLKKVFMTSTQDPTAKTNVTTDILSKLNANGYTRTLHFWHKDNNEWIDFGAMAIMTNRPFGSTDLSYQTLQSVTTNSKSDINTSQEGFLKDKQANLYQTVGGRDIVIGGNSSNGTPFDLILGSDFLFFEVRRRLFDFVVKNSQLLGKISFTQTNIDVIGTIIKDVMVLMSNETYNFLDEKSLSVKVPDVNSLDKSLRKAGTYVCQANSTSGIRVIDAIITILQ